MMLDFNGHSGNQPRYYPTVIVTQPNLYRGRKKNPRRLSSVGE